MKRGLRNICRLAPLVALAASVLLGCDALQGVGLPGQGPKFETKSSGLLFGKKMGVSPIYWLDNDRALFPAYANEKRLGPDGKEDWAPPGIFIWDTKNNTVTRHADLQRGPWFLCFNKGFLGYSIDGDMQGEQKVIKAGVLGQERELSQSLFWKLHPELDQCDDPEAEILSDHRGARAIQLRQQDGYIYVGQRTESLNLVNPDDTVKLYRPGQEVPVVLAILAKEMRSSAKLSYSEFAGKYIIIPDTWKERDVRSSINTWPRSHPYLIYLLSPDGKLETIEIPYGTWHPAAAFMTRRGLFWVSNDAPSTNSKQAGGWLLQDGKITKLFEHLVDGAGVSPDGCKIAYANNDFNPKTAEFVQVIELCK